MKNSITHRLYSKTIVLLFTIFTFNAFGQKDVPFFGKINWINGFTKEVSGENIGYFSAFPDYATTALLTRTTDGKKAIEWETAPVPNKIKSPYVYFSWVAAHSSGTSSGTRYFDLYLNDEKLLTFTTLPAHQKPNWAFSAPDSSMLVFQQTKRDGANDAHGLAFLRIPLSKVSVGKPVKLKIVGQSQKSNDWYMTFKFSFEEKVDINPMPFILKNGQQPIVLTTLHFGSDKTIKVTVNKTKNYSFTVTDGINNFDIPVNTVKQNDSILVAVKSGNKLLTNKYVPISPILPRTLHFIHHSHTDIGYSHLQPVVLKIHLKNIDDALKMIESTKNLPPEAQFKWNIESLWAVENYLKQAAPAQKEQFLAAVKNGEICLSALYANILTGLSQPEEMFHYLDYAAKFKKEYGFNINSAMISDIPGYAWTTVTALSKGGVKYFSSGPNFLGENHPYHGDRVGHFDKTWGDKPVWWSSPSGDEKVLFWTAAKGYSSWHGTAPGGVFEKAPKKIAAYLNELTASNYPYDMVQWRYNIVSDNGPIDTSISRFVAFWNEKYASPKIILNTTDKLFEEFEKKYGKNIPTIKGDITPYWEDGAVSTAHEEGKNRVNSLRLQQLTTLYAMLNPKKYDEQGFYDAWTNVIMFHEHTWGAHNSISQPDVPFVAEQWRIKKQFMLDADEQINALEKKLLQAIINPQSKKLIVYNTASWQRSDIVSFSSNIAGKSVKNAKGELLPLQKLSSGLYAFIAKDIPALGMATYTISDEDPPSVNPFILGENKLSNGKIVASWDNKGSITALKTTDDFNFAGDFNKQGLNSYWYVSGLNPKDALTNNNAQIKILEQGPVIKTISLTTNDVPGANTLEKRISLTAEGNELMIENILDKKAVRTKEAVHFGFPFNSSLLKTTLDAGYGSMQHLTDQLAGSNMDYLYGRRWLDVSAKDKGVQWLLLEMPLVEPENMIDERLTINQSHKEWLKQGRATSTWFSYAMNNYWHTNYKAEQEGMAHFRYALRPHESVNNIDMEKAATAFTQPLLAIPVQEDTKTQETLFELTNNHVVVTSITPTTDGNMIVRLFNPETTASETAFKWQFIQPSKIINVQTDTVIRNGDNLHISGMGVVEIMVVLK